jgi:hypothetical protein
VTLGPIQVALQVADALETCGLLYLVGGSVASSFGGEPRTTLDVDIVVAMAETDVDRFLQGQTLDHDYLRRGAEALGVGDLLLRALQNVKAR